jgi:zeaxanthin glucosyltransferase
VSRFLFVTLPLAGHVNPPAAVARVLAEHGHQVSWCGSRARLSRLLGQDAVIHPTGMQLFRGQPDTGMTAVKSLWQGFVVPFTRFTMPAVEQAVRDWRPDVVVADQHALAGPLVARRHGLPWATLCTASLELTAPFRGLPKVDGWIGEQIAAVTAAAGLADGWPGDLRFSPHLVIVFATAELLGGRSFPPHFALVGPALAARPDPPPFPWERLAPGRRRVLVTVGTMSSNVEEDFYGRVMRALAPLGDRIQPVLVVPPDVLPGLSDQVIAQARIPMLDLLPHLDAVVCHGGMNTVCEALSNAVPLVVAPLTRDQPANAANVVRAGAGIRLNFHRASPEQLRAAVLEVLGDPGYRAAAGRIRESFTAAGGALTAATRLERLAAESNAAESNAADYDVRADYVVRAEAPLPF